MTKGSLENADELWIAGIVAKDPKTIQAIYQTCFSLVLKFIRKNKGSREDAEDIFQDALIIIYQKSLQGLVIEVSFKSYFLAVCKYLWFNKVRKRQAQIIEPTDDQKWNESFSDVDILIEDQEKRKLFKRKLSQLSPACQAVLNSFFNGESMKEIAANMGFKSEGYAKKKKFQCKQALIKMIQEDPIFRELKQE